MEKFTIKYSYDFWDDLKQVIGWYDAVSKDVSNKLLDEIWFAENKLINNPYAFRKVNNKGFRRILVTHFKYNIYFKIINDVVIVIALIHSSRSNRYKTKRLK